MPNQPKTPIRAVRVPDELWHAAQAEAKRRGEPVSAVILRALTRYARQQRQHHQQQSLKQAERARQYMADIAKINRDFGMGTTTSEETYAAAVSEAEAAFSWVDSAKARTQQ